MDAWLLQQKIAMVGVVMVQWFVVGVLPAFVVGYFPMPPGPEILVFTTAAAYCFWTGYRAWKRGWKARFVLRLAIPIAILAISTFVVALIKVLALNGQVNS